MRDIKSLKRMCGGGCAEVKREAKPARGAFRVLCMYCDRPLWNFFPSPIVSSIPEVLCDRDRLLRY